MNYSFEPKMALKTINKNNLIFSIAKNISYEFGRLFIKKNKYRQHSIHIEFISFLLRTFINDNTK